MNSSKVVFSSFAVANFWCRRATGTVVSLTNWKKNTPCLNLFHRYRNFSTRSTNYRTYDDLSSVSGTADPNLRNWSPAIQLNKQTQPFTIVVEGNIGSGKTTLLQHFKKFSDKIAVLDEPVRKWRDVHGHNLLDLMYTDPVKWSLCFQSYVQMTMLDLHTTPVDQPIKLMERSIFSAKYCFTNNLKEQGFMSDVEHAVISDWFDFIRTEIPLRVDLIVYLRTDPEVVYDRILKRGRSEENAISLDYLKSIHKLHEEWLIQKKFYVPAPVVTYDANEDLTIMAKNYSLCEDAIFQKIPVAN